MNDLSVAEKEKKELLDNLSSEAREFLERRGVYMRIFDAHSDTSKFIYRNKKRNGNGNGNTKCVILANLKLTKEDLIRKGTGLRLPDLSEIKVKGNFDIRGLGLTTLKGCPSIVTGQFDCSDNKLTSLKGGAREVGGKMEEMDQGTSEKWVGYIDCSKNPITPQALGRTVPKKFSILHSDDKNLEKSNGDKTLTSLSENEWQDRMRTFPSTYFSTSKNRIILIHFFKLQLHQILL